MHESHILTYLFCMVGKIILIPNDVMGIEHYDETIWQKQFKKEKNYFISQCLRVSHSERKSVIRNLEQPVISLTESGNTEDRMNALFSTCVKISSLLCTVQHLEARNIVTYI